MNINTNEFIQTLNPNKEIIVFGTGVGTCEETGKKKPTQKIIYRGLPSALSQMIGQWTKVVESYHNEAFNATVLRVEQDEVAYNEFENKEYAVVWSTQTVEKFHKSHIMKGA